jgi:hypothetical protein
MRIIEEHLDIKNVARKVLGYPCDHDVNAAFPQLPMFQCRGIRLKNTNNDLRESTRQLVDGGWHQPFCQKFRTRNSHFSYRRVRQKLNILDCLLQLVEYDVAALKKRLSINGRFDALWGSVKETDANCRLKVQNRLGYGRLGHRCDAAFAILPQRTTADRM